TVPTPQTIASLRRDADAHRCLTEALATAYATGHHLDFAGRRSRPYRSLDLPTYPFQRRSYWFPATTDPVPSRRQRVIEAEPAEARTGDWLTGVPPEHRLDCITELIRTEIGDALRMPAAEIDPSVEFIGLGMDSMIAMELRRRLQAALGTEVPASLL